MSVKQFVYSLQKGRLWRRSRYDTLLEDVIPQQFCDHSAFWKLEDGTIIYTTMPYYHGYNISEECKMIAEACKFPATIKISFLDDKYRYRTNGDYFIVIYDESRLQI